MAINYRPIKSAPSDPRLGRLIPDDWKHYEKWGLTDATIPVKPVPVVIGVNWYSDFDNPVWKGGRWWIGLDPKNLGSIRGGHCVCLEPGDELDPETKKVVHRYQDTPSWYKFYNQGHEGACVGFGSSRLMTLMNRKLYFARWLWDRAKETDPWGDTNPGDDNGTSVDAAMRTLRDRGHVTWKPSYEEWNTDGESADWQPRSGLAADKLEGIQTFRWARTTEQVLDVLKSPANLRAGAVRILNSWGTDYPQRVWMPGETLQRLINEEGEVALVTDR
jgi:hypothetical protein